MEDKMHNSFDPSDKKPSSSKESLLKAYKASMSNVTKKDITYDEKIAFLIEMWHLAKNLIAIADPELIPNILRYAIHHILHLMLLGEWKDVSKSDKQKLYDLVKSCIPNIDTSTSPVAYRCKYILNVMFTPWSDPVLKKLLNQSGSETVPINDQIDFFTKERSCMISLRINKLCEDKCEDMALNLASAYWKCYAHLLSNQPQHMFLEATQQSEAQNGAIYDHFIVLLVKFKKHGQFQEEMEKLTLDYKLRILQRLPSTQLATKELTKYFKKTTSLVANTLIQDILTHPDPTNLNLTKIQFIDIDKTLPDTNVDTTNSRLLPSDMFYVKVLTEWMKFNMKENENKFEKSLSKLMNVTKLPKHLYKCSNTLKEMYKIRFEALTIELHVRGLTLDLNQYEKMKMESSSEAEMLKTEYLLSTKFMELYDLIKQNIQISRECVLTAFSLNPCQEIYQSVREAGRICGVLTNNDDENAVSAPSSSNISSDNLFLKTNDVCELPDYLQSDILTILLSPRLKQLSWQLDWDELDEELLKLLELPEKLNLIRKQLLVSNNDLKFLDLNYALFEHLPEVEYPGIEKGYEEFMDTDSEDSDDWYDDEVVKKSRTQRKKNLEETQIAADLDNEIVYMSADSVVKVVDSIDSVATGNETVDIEEVYQICIAPLEIEEEELSIKKQPKSVNRSRPRKTKSGANWFDDLFDMVGGQNSDDDDAIWDVLTEEDLEEKLFAHLKRYPDGKTAPTSYHIYERIINQVSQEDFPVDYDAILAATCDELYPNDQVKRELYNKNRREKRRLDNELSRIKSSLLKKSEQVISRRNSLTTRKKVPFPGTVVHKKRRNSETDCTEPSNLHEILKHNMIFKTEPVVTHVTNTVKTRNKPKEKLLNDFEPIELKPEPIVTEISKSAKPKKKPKRRFVDVVACRPRRAAEEKLINDFERETVMKVRKRLFRVLREEETGKAKKPTKAVLAADEELLQAHCSLYPVEPVVKIESQPKQEYSGDSSALDMLASVACDRPQNNQYQSNISTNSNSDLMIDLVQKQYASKNAHKIDIYDAVAMKQKFYVTMQHLQDHPVSVTTKRECLTLNERGMAIQEWIQYVLDSQLNENMNPQPKKLKYSDIVWFKKYCLLPQHQIKPFRMFGEYLRQHFGSKLAAKAASPIKRSIVTYAKKVNSSIEPQVFNEPTNFIKIEPVIPSPEKVQELMPTNYENHSMTLEEIITASLMPNRCVEMRSSRPFGEIVAIKSSPPVNPPAIPQAEPKQTPVIQVTDDKQIKQKTPTSKRPRKSTTKLYATGVPSLVTIATHVCTLHKMKIPKKPAVKRPRKLKDNDMSEGFDLNLYSTTVPTLAAIARHVCAIYKLKLPKKSIAKKPRTSISVENGVKSSLFDFGVPTLSAIAGHVCKIHKIKRPTKGRPKKPKLQEVVLLPMGMSFSEPVKKTSAKRPRKPKPPTEPPIPESTGLISLPQVCEIKKSVAKKPRPPKPPTTDSSVLPPSFQYPDRFSQPPLIDPIDAVLAELLGLKNEPTVPAEPHIHKTMLHEMLESNQRQINGNFGIIPPSMYPEYNQNVGPSYSISTTQSFVPAAPQNDESKTAKEKKPPREKKPPKEKPPPKEKKSKATTKEAASTSKHDTPETFVSNIIEQQPSFSNNSQQSSPVTFNKTVSYTEIILPGKFPLNLKGSPSTSSGMIDFESCLESIIPASVISAKVETARATSSPVPEILVEPVEKKRKPAARKPKQKIIPEVGIRQQYLGAPNNVNNVLDSYQQQQSNETNLNVSSIITNVANQARNLSNQGCTDFEECLNSAMIPVGNNAKRTIVPSIVPSTSSALTTANQSSTVLSQPNIVQRPSIIVANGTAAKLAEIKTIHIDDDNQSVEVIEVSESDSSDGCEIVNTIEVCKGTKITLRVPSDPLEMTTPNKCASSKNGKEDDKQTKINGNVDPVAACGGVGGAVYHQKIETNPSTTNTNANSSDFEDLLKNPKKYRTYGNRRRKPDTLTLPVAKSVKTDFVFLAPSDRNEEIVQTNDDLSTMNVSSDEESESEVIAPVRFDAAALEQKFIGNIIRQRRATLGSDSSTSSILVRHDYINNKKGQLPKNTSSGPRNVLNINMLYRIDEVTPKSINQSEMKYLDDQNFHSIKETRENLENLVSKSGSAAFVASRRFTFPLCASDFNVDANSEKLINGQKEGVLDELTTKAQNKRLKRLEKSKLPPTNRRKNYLMKVSTKRRPDTRLSKKASESNNHDSINNETNFVLKNAVVTITRNKLYDDSPPRNSNKSLNELKSKNHSLRDHNHQEGVTKSKLLDDRKDQNDNQKNVRTRSSAKNNKMTKNSTNFYLNCIVNMDYSSIFRKYSYSDDNPKNFGANLGQKFKFLNDLTMENECDKKRLANDKIWPSNDPKHILKNVPGMTNFEFFELPHSQQLIEIVEVSKTSNNKRQETTETGSQAIQPENSGTKSHNPTSVSAHIQRIGVPSTLPSSLDSETTLKILNGTSTNSLSVIKSHSSTSAETSVTIQSSAPQKLPNNIQFKTKADKVVGEGVPLINILSQQILVPANSSSPICTTRVKEQQKPTMLNTKPTIVKQQEGNTIINLSSTNAISSQQLLEILNNSIKQQQQLRTTQASALPTKIFTTQNTTIQPIANSAAPSGSTVTMTGNPNMVQFLCKSDGRMIQLTPINTIKSPNATTSQDNLEFLSNAVSLKSQTYTSQPQLIVTRKDFQYADAIDNKSSNLVAISTSVTKSGVDTLPKFNQAFGGRTFHTSTGGENGKLPTTVITNNITKLITTPSLIKRNVNVKTELPSENKNIRIINYDASGHIINDTGSNCVKVTTPITTYAHTQTSMSNIKLMRTTKAPPLQHQKPASIQIDKQNSPLRVSMPIIQQNSTLMQTRLPIIQLPQNVLNSKQPQTLLIATPRVLTGANSTNSGVCFENFIPTSSAGGHQQFIQIPVSRTQILNNTKPTQNQTQCNNVDNSTLEQLREFDLVLEQVKERSCGSTEPPSVASSPEQVTTNVVQVLQSEKSLQDSNVKQETVFNNSQQVLQKINLAILSPNQLQNRAEPFVVVSNYGGVSNKNITFTPQTVQMSLSPSTIATLVKSSTNKTIFKTEEPSIASTPMSSNETESHSLCGGSLTKLNAHMTPLTITTTTTQAPPIPAPKPVPKPLEDEQTVQRIYDILAGYAEQLRNSPDLNNKPAPRRRTNPPTNPAQPSSSGSGPVSSVTKRKKSSYGGSISSFSSEQSPNDTDRQTLESEDSSCDVSNGGTVYSKDVDPDVMIVEEQEESKARVQIRSAVVPTSKLITTIQSPFSQQLILTDNSQSQQQATTSGDSPSTGITRNFLIASHQPGTGNQLMQNVNGNAVLLPRNYLVPINFGKNGQITILSSPKANNFQAAIPPTVTSEQKQFAQISNTNNIINITQPQMLSSGSKPASSDGKSIAGKTFILQSYLNQQQQFDKQKYAKTPTTSASVATSRNNSSLIIQTIKKAQSQSSLVDQPLKIVTSSSANLKAFSSSTDVGGCVQMETPNRTESILMLAKKTNDEIESGININDVKEEIEIFYENDTNSEVIGSYRQDLENSGYVINMKASDEDQQDNVEQITIIQKVDDFKMEEEDDEEEIEDTVTKNFHSTNILSNYLTSHSLNRNSNSGAITYNPKKLILNENRKIGFYESQSKKNLYKHKQSAAEREFLLQKSLSEECEDLGVDEPSTSDLFPEADLLFDPNSPTCSGPNSAHLDQSSQESLTDNNEKKMKSISVNSYLRHYSQSEESISTIQQLTPTTTRFPVKFMNKIRDLNRDNDLLASKKSEIKTTLSVENIMNDNSTEDDDSVFTTETCEVSKSIKEVELKLQNDRKFKKFLLRSKSLASQQQIPTSAKQISLSLGDESSSRKRQLSAQQDEAMATTSSSLVTVKKFFLTESKIVTDQSSVVKTSVSKTNTFVTTTSKVLTTKCIKRAKRK